MKPEIDIEMDRQVVYAGEEVRGRISLAGIPQYKSLAVTLQGEEVLGANNVVGSLVYPVIDQAQTCQYKVSEFNFVFPLSEEAPPSYASQDVRCQYIVKARLQTGVGKDVIRRIQLTVLPEYLRELPEDPHDLVIEEDGIRLEAHLNRSALASGEICDGSYVLSRADGGATLQGRAPSRINFRLAAIEESTSTLFSHRRVLWVQSHDVEPKQDDLLPISGNFMFTIARDAPFSGEWTSFRVHYGFRMGMSFAGGRQVRRSLPMYVYRRYTAATRGLGIE